MPKDINLNQPKEEMHRARFGRVLDKWWVTFHRVLPSRDAPPILVAHSFDWGFIMSAWYIEPLAMLLNLQHSFPPWRLDWYHMAQRTDPLFTWLLFLAWPAPILSHLISINKGSTMNNKDIPITLEIPRVQRLFPRNEEQKQTKFLLTQVPSIVCLPYSTRGGGCHRRRKRGRKPDPW